jgi:hypothetical protein
MFLYVVSNKNIKYDIPMFLWFPPAKTWKTIFQCFSALQQKDSGRDATV